jgi:hypothetical protein
MVEDIITAMLRFKSLMSQTVRTESGRRSKLFIVLVKHQIPAAHTTNRSEWHPQKGAEHEGR